jgi:hypothetical protein
MQHLDNLEAHGRGVGPVTQPPFGMDPAARFDDEVARIARENDADVVFQLVEREDSSMAEAPKCELHDHTATLRAERFTFTITDPDGKVSQIVVCKEHGIWLHAQKPERDLPSGSNERATRLKPQLAQITVTGGRRVQEPIDRGPGGGPGGRSMAPDLPPPPEKIDRTIPPRYDGPRLVVGRLGGFGRGSIQAGDPLITFNRMSAEGLLELLCVVNSAMQVVRVIKVGDTLWSVAKHLGRHSPPPGIAQLTSPILSNLGPSVRNLFAAGS